MKKVFYVARGRAGEYASRGYDTGMGRSIGSTPDPLLAIRADSPAGLMAQLSGHYVGYEAVRVTTRTDLEVDEVVAWADPKEVWP